MENLQVCSLTCFAFLNAKITLFLSVYLNVLFCESSLETAVLHCWDMAWKHWLTCGVLCWSFGGSGTTQMEKDNTFW